jgi:hypothetical protein
MGDYLTPEQTAVLIKVLKKKGELRFLDVFHTPNPSDKAANSTITLPLPDSGKDEKAIIEYLAEELITGFGQLESGTVLREFLVVHRFPSIETVRNIEARQSIVGMTFYWSIVK